jgi:hypothetical protein
MKKLLITSTTLFLFSASILMFQISCSKDANAGNSGGSGTMSQGKVLILKSNNNTFQFAIIDKNGLETIINLNLPTPYSQIDQDEYTTDGNIIFFKAYDMTNPNDPNGALFTCDMNGGNVKNLKNIKFYTCSNLSIF